MNRTVHGGGLVILIALALTLAPNAAGMAPLTVKSTLDGKTTLPSRLRWTATTNAPPSAISDVSFLIDGKLRWAEQQPPYVYGGGAIGREGFLFTSWLTPGEHRFTVSVTEKNGTKDTDSVTARVLPAPQPPAALAGAWTRVVTAQDAQKAQPQYGSPPPLGRWKVIFDRVGAWDLVPGGPGIVEAYDAEPGIIHVYAPIQMTPPAADNSGYGGFDKFGHHILTSGGTDCDNAGPFGTYRWTVTKTTLTLTPIHEGCPDRAAVWEGTWTRTNV
jgi:hypothetical protein